MAPSELQELAEGMPHDALAFVDRHREEIVPDTDWHGFAEVASTNASFFYPSEPDKSVGWSEVAVKVYDELAIHAQDDRQTQWFEQSAMDQRTAAICRYRGARRHPSLDGSIVERWFFRRLDLDMGEAEKLVRNLNTLPQPAFQRVAQLLDRVRIIARLASTYECRRHAEVTEWVALLTLVPISRQ